MTADTEIFLRPANSTDKYAGFILAVTALLSLLAILHHPTLEGVHSAKETVDAIRALAGMDKLVHGTLMLIFSAQAIGFYYFCRQLGFGRLTVLAGFVAQMIGTVVLIIPTTLDGFVTPDLVDACARSAECGVLPKATIYLIAVAIQDFTKIALVAISLATLLWSLALITLPGMIHRAIGALGLLCGVGPIAVFALSSLTLQPDNLAAIMMAPIVWTLAVALLLILPPVSDGTRH